MEDRISTVLQMHVGLTRPLSQIEHGTGNATAADGCDPYDKWYQREFIVYFVFTPKWGGAKNNACVFFCKLQCR